MEKKSRKAVKKQARKGLAQNNKPSREEIIAEAMSNARKATEEIGQDTLQKIAQAMIEKEQSATEQAKRKIKSMDEEIVADHVRQLLDDK